MQKKEEITVAARKGKELPIWPCRQVVSAVYDRRHARVKIENFRRVFARER